MHNFKIAHANLKDPNISSLRMNHFKIAHISTWLATATLVVTVKILKFGTPQTIAIIVLKIEKFDVTLH